MLEPLEERWAPARFAVIGDYGQAGSHEQAVANRIHNWNPEFIVTVGDNNYPAGAASTIDANIGQYYHDFIYPYTGGYGSGASSNLFWPAIGNHDWDTSTDQYRNSYRPYLDYFALPNNERYYTFSSGNLQLFAINSDSNEPNGTSSTSTQGQWLQNQLASSTATWKIVYFHHPPYSSTAQQTTRMRWPFQAWGASLVMSGHAHNYERLVENNNFPYFVDGLGGDSKESFGTPVAGSQVRYNADFGAMLVDAQATSLTLQFITQAGTVVDTYTLYTNPEANLPAVPTNLTATATSSSQINLSWRDNSSNEDQFQIQRSTDGISFSQVASVSANVTSYSDTGLSAGTRYYYKIVAHNQAGDAASAVANATTQGTASTHLGVNAPSSSTAGQAFSITVTALDANNNTLTSYRGTVQFSSSDGQALLPGNYTFTAADNGVHTFSNAVTLKTAGSQSIIATDTGTGSITGSDSVSVSAAAVHHLNVAAPTTATAGTAFNVTVTAQDAYNNTVTSYRGQVHFTSSDRNATLPKNYSFKSSDHGVHTFSMTLRTTGNQTVTVTDTHHSSTTGTATVNVTNTPAPAGAQPSGGATSQVLPAAPSELMAVAVSPTQINLAWTDNATTETGFRIERSLDGTSWAPIGTVGANVRSFSDSGLRAGTQYYYRVRAYNAVGDSPYADWVDVFIPL
jgi:hypothetical protein